MIDRIGRWMFVVLAGWAFSCLAIGGQAVRAAASPARLENGRVRVAFDLAQGTYDLSDVAADRTVIKGACAEVAEWTTKDAAYARTAKNADVADELGKGRSLTVECAAVGKPSLLLEFRLYDGKPFVAIRGGWKNTSQEPLRVHDFRPMTGGTVLAGGRWSDVRTLTANTACIDPRVERSPFASCANNLLLTFKRDGRRCSLVLGALKTAEFTKWTHTLPEGDLSVRETALDHSLPGCKLAAYLDCGSDARRLPRPGVKLSLEQGTSYRFNPYYFPVSFSGRAECDLISSIVFHEKAVEFAASKLDPGKRYILGFSWWDANADGRVGTVAALDKNGKSHTLAEKLKLPSGRGEQGIPREYALAIPRDAYADGTLALEFSNAAAVPNIAVSEVWLWETENDRAIPQEWADGRAVSQSPPSTASPSAISAVLEAGDPVGKLIEPGETYLPDDDFYVDFLTADPFAALESYAQQLKAATHAQPNPYDFPTVCAWYVGVWRTKGAQNHPEKSTYKINTTPGIVEEAAEIKKCGFLNYSRAAARLVPDNYTPDNPQGWWDDEHWRQHGLYAVPYETTEKYARGVHQNGCLAFTYFQSVNTSEDFRKSHVDWLCGKDEKRTLDYTLPAVQEHLRKVFAAMRGNIDGLMFDYADELWGDEAVKGGFADPRVTSTGYYRTLYRFAKEGLGPNSWVHERNLFRPNNDLTLGIIDLQRTSNDTDKITPELLTRSGLRWYKNRVVINYDMDSKELTNGWKIPGWAGADADGRRMMLTMAYVASGRLLMANSFRDLSKETLHDLTRVFPFPTEPKSARPIDAFSHAGFPRVYDFAVSPRWHQLTLYNNTLPTREETLTVPLAGEQVSGALGLDPAKEYYFYDFWNDRFAGRLKGSDSLVQKLRPGEARMLAVHEVEPNPQFLATDRHLMQGYLDLTKQPEWNGAKKTLSGVSKVVAGEPYRVILATNGYKPLAAVVSGKGAKAEVEPLDAARGLAVLTLESPDNAAAEWTVTFGR
ncbi:MAG: hypothetical protein IT426_09515 [Pirellulales bacterium]|nr:hypothetical protein [Pirellulales bacterium]